MVTKVVHYICDKCDLDFDIEEDAEKHEKRCDRE